MLKKFKFLCKRLSIFAINSLYFSLCAFLITPLSKADDMRQLLPRLWQITPPASESTRQNLIFVLAITHAGIAGEFDEYFNSIVLPKFMLADRLYFEGAGGGENEEFPICDSSILTSSGKKTLSIARGKLALMMYQIENDAKKKAGIKTSNTRSEYVRQLSAKKQLVEVFDEYQILTLLKSYSETSLDGIKSLNKITDSSKSKIPNNIISRLTNIRAGLNIGASDIDSKFGARRAYCNSGRDRIKIISTMLDVINDKDYNRDAAELEITNALNILLSGKSLPKTSILMKVSSLDQQFICQRNSEWLREIRNSPSEIIRFYAVGARHLFNVDHDGIKCRGLLGDLVENGYSVTLLK